MTITDAPRAQLIDSPVGSDEACKQLRYLLHSNVLTSGAENMINELLA